MVLGPEAGTDRSVDVEMLRFDHGRFGFSLVVPHCLHRPDCFDQCTLPEECRCPILRLLLGRLGCSLTRAALVHGKCETARTS